MTPADSDRLARQDIAEVLTLYGSLLDRGEVEDWLALFTDDAVMEVRGSGLDSVKARRQLAENAPRGVHLANPPVISADGTQADSVQTFVFWNAETQTGLPGVYQDELALIEGAWKIRRRQIQFITSSLHPTGSEESQ